MKPHTYTFTYIGCAGTRQHGDIEAASKDGAYLATMADTRLKGCKILKGSFRRLDIGDYANAPHIEPSNEPWFGDLKED